MVNQLRYTVRMNINFRSLYQASEEQAKIAWLAFSLLLVLGFIGTVFFSPVLVVVMTISLMAIFFVFTRPEWALLAFAVYLPFEPFLLKASLQ